MELWNGLVYPGRETCTFLQQGCSLGSWLGTPHVPESLGQPTQQTFLDCRKHTAPVMAVVPHDTACAAEDFFCMRNKVEGSLK